MDGANLVATMTRLRDIVPAIRHHHENWDGTGYPDRLAGEMIPLASRIIRFSDTIDAMTTQRPYRGPLTEPEVRSEVIRYRGIQFDPTIADQLLSSPLWFSLFSSPAIAEVATHRDSRSSAVPEGRTPHEVFERRAECDGKSAAARRADPMLSSTCRSAGQPSIARRLLEYPGVARQVWGAASFVDNIPSS